MGLRRVRRAVEAVTSQPDDVSLAVEPGTLIALTSAWGAGECTLLHLISTIEAPAQNPMTAARRGGAALRGGALAAYRRTVRFIYQSLQPGEALTPWTTWCARIPFRPPDRLERQAGRGHQLVEGRGAGLSSRILPARMSGDEETAATAIGRA